MVTDKQVRRLIQLLESGEKKNVAAMKAGMDEKTARKYVKAAKLPRELKSEYRWRTRKDPFEGVWSGVKEKLELFPGIEALTLFEWLQRKHPGRFFDGQLRTLQRRVKGWKAFYGPGKEVFFPQEHHPGELSASDFTHMESLGITIDGQPFDHLLYHFVLTYSNWETGNVCFSESYESLSSGLQNALWKLGGVPQMHRTDSLSAAVNNLNDREEFTRRYTGLLRHYGIKGSKTQAGKGNENGDVEQRHYRLKRAIDQALMLRGSRDFKGRAAYEEFLEWMFRQLNAGRKTRLKEELQILKRLPDRRLEDCRKIQASVGPSSTIRVQKNVYSVHSRLIGEKVEVRLYAEYLEVWYAQRCLEKIPRLRGESKHRVNYRHIIDWLVRKPGAFANYRYRSDLFPSSRFRIAYDILNEQRPTQADKEYLKILHVAAREDELGVNTVLEKLIDGNESISADLVERMLQEEHHIEQIHDPYIKAINLNDYDALYDARQVVGL